MIRLSLAATAAAALALLSGIASAHVTLEASMAPADSTYKAVLRVGHGCDGAATTKIRVQVPLGVRQAKPMPKPGWELTTVIEKLPEPYDWYGTTITEEVREIEWSGGKLPDAFYDDSCSAPACRTAPVQSSASPSCRNARPACIAGSRSRRPGNRPTTTKSRRRS
jgi:periplasmic copper chaperone A